jgi:hypothetical protein
VGPPDGWDDSVIASAAAAAVSKSLFLNPPEHHFAGRPAAAKSRSAQGPIRPLP